MTIAIDHPASGTRPFGACRALAIAAILLAEPATVLAAGAPAAHGGGGAFPPFESATFSSQLFWLALVFGALYYMMNKFALPRIAETLETRAQTIATALSEASAAQKQAEEAGAAQAAALAKARAEAEAIGRAAKDAGAREMDSRRTAVEAELNAKMVAAEAEIAAAKAKAMTNVATIATDAAGAIVEQLAGAAPAEAEISAAIARASQL